MNRNPVVAGQFYPADAEQLEAMVKGFVATGQPTGETPLLVMLPHAGYPYSGPVAGKTLGEVTLQDTVILLGPNHTGCGEPFAVWPGGPWNIPGAEVSVEARYAAWLEDKVPGFSFDVEAHMGEHSLEVLLPFLRAANPDVKVVPVAIAERRLEALAQAGNAIAEVVTRLNKPVTIVVSSDMNHFASHEQTKALDEMAIERILALDPAGLYETVRDKGISMCGVLPMVVGMTAAIKLGADKARLVDYATSGDVTGDLRSVVGYAGVVIG